jgi:lipoprotein-anchoring transpeptidase ErfK/SrfK
MVAVITLVVAACAPTHTISTGSAPATPVAAPPRIVVTPRPGAVQVNPTQRIQVDVTDGVLASVVMTNEQGRHVSGVLTPDSRSWKANEPLGYGRTYTLNIAATGRTASRTQMSTFSTVAPPNQTMVYLTSTAGSPLTEGVTYGIGTVIVAHFDEPIPDRAAALKHLKVTTVPPITGSWYWLDDRNAHWRPQNYYLPGTVVTVAADLYGVPLGEGLYGQEDTATSFRIGDAHVSVADDNSKEVSVYDNGALVRSMPTSMGRGGTETIGGQTISFWTQPGVYTVMDKANPVVMDSSTYGLPINSRLGYKESIAWATRISADGVYLHELDSTVWAQGTTNVSHGCLNLNAANAQWFYEFSNPGDVVEVRNTGGAPLAAWQNGDWSVPWEQWLRDGAV